MRVVPATPSVGTAGVWFVLSYGAAVVGYVAVSALASRLLHHDFGYFHIAMSASLDAALLALFGAHRGALRQAARLDPADDAGLVGLRRDVRAISLFTLPAAAAAGAVGAWLLSGGQERTTRLVLAASVGAVIWLSGRQKLIANVLRGLGSVRFAGLVEGRSGGALVAACQCVAVGAVILLVPAPSVAVVLGAVAVGFAGPVLFAHLLLRRRWSHVKMARPRLADAQAAMSQNRHFASNLVAAALNTNIDLWLAGLLLTAYETSLFSAAERVSTLLPVVTMSLGVVASPLVSRSVGHRSDELESLLRTGATVAAGLTLLLWLPMLLAPGAVLRLIFGDAFGPAAVILVILTLGGMSNVLTGACSVALSMSGHEAIVSRVQWAAVALRSALGLVLVSMFGVTGLAISASGVTALMWCALWWFSLRRTGIRTHPTSRPDVMLLRRVPA
ncbi:MAG: hypothetical protein AVDCRST_MAG34-116 [uncultured Nocardioidaceae bacterium]|uniref:Polysaccharide biosynthesis protein C-terminal domain-containing protein n=1 Tax=uncultured Nocardioidaceae bacterium TaxID=253824 RepID=A0A6J4LD77_9ACTN|nr:MAG: hypothetical protein AVDCRST_MAG34-116 [uncultured Nocardioidaceae bacterium]